MAQWIHDKDPRSPNIERLLQDVPKCPGVCLFIDIVDSTWIKYREPFTKWGQKLNNTFNFISLLNDFPDNIVKGIGDEIMLYIPENVLHQKTTFRTCFALMEEIYATLDNIKNFPVDGLFLPCKVAIHYCTEAYNVTFLEGYNDYYGKDIDLSARLMSKAKPYRIVLSEKFYQKVQEDIATENIQKEQGCLKFITEKYIEDFKGVPRPVEYRVIQV